MTDILDEYAQHEGITRAEAAELLRPVNEGTRFMRVANMPWWRRRYYAIAPATPLSPRKILRRWTLFGIVFAMRKERDRRRYLARGVGVSDTEWSDW